MPLPPASPAPSLGVSVAAAPAGRGQGDSTSGPTHTRTTRASKQAAAAPPALALSGLNGQKPGLNGQKPVVYSARTGPHTPVPPALDLNEVMGKAAVRPLPNMALPASKAPAAATSAKRAQPAAADNEAHSHAGPQSGGGAAAEGPAPKKTRKNAGAGAASKPTTTHSPPVKAPALAAAPASPAAALVLPQAAVEDSSPPCAVPKTPTTIPTSPPTAALDSADFTAQLQAATAAVAAATAAATAVATAAAQHPQLDASFIPDGLSHYTALAAFDSRPAAHGNGSGSGSGRGGGGGPRSGRGRKQALSEMMMSDDEGDEGEGDDGLHGGMSGSHQAGGTVSTGGGGAGEDPDRARVRREKNRVAARKCRQKKVQALAKMQRDMSDIIAQNQDMKQQVVTWHNMFKRELQLREGMQRVIQMVWAATSAAAATGHTANDVLMGLEAGTLDINSLALTGHPPTPYPPTTSTTPLHGTHPPTLPLLLPLPIPGPARPPASLTPTTHTPGASGVDGCDAAAAGDGDCGGGAAGPQFTPLAAASPHPTSPDLLMSDAAAAALPVPTPVKHNTRSGAGRAAAGLRGAPASPAAPHHHHQPVTRTRRTTAGIAAGSTAGIAAAGGAGPPLPRLSSQDMEMLPPYNTRMIQSTSELLTDTPTGDEPGSGCPPHAIMHHLHLSHLTAPGADALPSWPLPDHLPLHHPHLSGPAPGFESTAAAGAGGVTLPASHFLGAHSNSYSLSGHSFNAMMMSLMDGGDGAGSGGGGVRSSGGGGGGDSWGGAGLDGQLSGLTTPTPLTTTNNNNTNTAQCDFTALTCPTSPTCLPTSSPHAPSPRLAAAAAHTAQHTHITCAVASPGISPRGDDLDIMVSTSRAAGRGAQINLQPLDGLGSTLDHPPRQRRVVDAQQHVLRCGAAGGGSGGVRKLRAGYHVCVPHVCCSPFAAAANNQPDIPAAATNEAATAAVDQPMEDAAAGAHARVDDGAAQQQQQQQHDAALAGGPVSFTTYQQQLHALESQFAAGSCCFIHGSTTAGAGAGAGSAADLAKSCSSLLRMNTSQLLGSSNSASLEQFLNCLNGGAGGGGQLMLDGRALTLDDTSDQAAGSGDGASALRSEASKQCADGSGGAAGAGGAAGLLAGRLGSAPSLGLVNCFSLLPSSDSLTRLTSLPRTGTSTALPTPHPLLTPHPSPSPPSPTTL